METKIEFKIKGMDRLVINHFFEGIFGVIELRNDNNVIYSGDWRSCDSFLREEIRRRFEEAKKPNDLLEMLR